MVKDMEEGNGATEMMINEAIGLVATGTLTADEAAAMYVVRGEMDYPLVYFSPETAEQAAVLTQIRVAAQSIIANQPGPVATPAKPDQYPYRCDECGAGGQQEEWGFCPMSEGGEGPHGGSSTR